MVGGYMHVLNHASSQVEDINIVSFIGNKEFNIMFNGKHRYYKYDKQKIARICIVPIEPSCFMWTFLNLAVDFFQKFILDMHRFLVKMFFHDTAISDLWAQIQWEQCCVSCSHHGERQEAAHWIHV